MDEPEPLQVQSPGWPVLLERVEINDLFGARSYVIEKPADADGRLFLLHGENGSGKTTLLRLIWHILSIDDGHREYVTNTPFSRLELHAVEGWSLLVEKQEEQLVGTYSVRRIAPGEEDLVATYSAEETFGRRLHAAQAVLRAAERASSRSLRNAQSDASLTSQIPFDFGEELFSAQAAQSTVHDFVVDQQIHPNLFADDRSLYADDPELDRLRERIAMQQGRNPRARESQDRNVVVNELRLTMRRVNDWLTGLTLRGQNTGSAQANSIYLDILARLAGGSTGQARDDDEQSVRETIERLQLVAPRFETYDLAPPLNGDRFLELIDAIGDQELSRLAQQILLPYLESLSKRYQALAEAQRILDALLPLINEFLSGKQALFTPREGLSIVASDGTVLGPEALSSGERQLVMLLCTTLMAGHNSRLLLIDEPELSLGVAWQRKIVDSLLDLTADTSLQFIIATHSVEVMSGRPDCLIRLRPA